jgi:hypothetical protein
MQPSLYYDATLWPDATVRSMRQQDWSTIDAGLLDSVTRLVRSPRYQGPLELELDVGDLPMPWADWMRDGYLAVLLLHNAAGQPLTYSLLVGRSGVPGEAELLDALTHMHPLAAAWRPEPGDSMVPIAGVPRRPLLATHIMTPDPETAQLLSVCADVETVFASTFFRHLRVGAPDSERWDT